MVTALWDSWEEDAFIRNKETGVFFDSHKLHRIHHKGKFFSVQGPLNIGPSKQGHPILVQAGSSVAGQHLGAKWAEVIFSINYDYEDAKEFYHSFKRKVASYGRSPDDVYILQGISPIIGKTEKEAYEKWKELDSLITEDMCLRFLTDYFKGVNFSGYTLQSRAADLGLDTLALEKADYKKHQPVIARENPTLRELYSLLTGAFSHSEFIRTPEKIANTLEKWFNERAADGFMIMAPLLPDGLQDFVTEVVPILQERGLFRTDYKGDTLRDHLHLSKPENRFTKVLKS